VHLAVDGDLVTGIPDMLPDLIRSQVSILVILAQ
jgi:hypothetical protein